LDFKKNTKFSRRKLTKIAENRDHIIDPRAASGLDSVIIPILWLVGRSIAYDCSLMARCYKREHWSKCFQKLLSKKCLIVSTIAEVQKHSFNDNCRNHEMSIRVARFFLGKKYQNG
jgi:hypothetical protein